MNIEHTCILIKPDAMRNKKSGAIIARFEAAGYKVVGCKLMRMSEVLIREHYAHVAHESFFSDLENFMKSAPVLALVLAGENVVEKVREMTGKNFEDAGTLRGEFATCSRENAIHSSDTVENAEAEILRFFSAQEIFA